MYPISMICSRQWPSMERISKSRVHWMYQAISMVLRFVSEWLDLHMYTKAVSCAVSVQGRANGDLKWSSAYASSEACAHVDGGWWKSEHGHDCLSNVLQPNYEDVAHLIQAIPIRKCLTRSFMGQHNHKRLCLFDDGLIFFLFVFLWCTMISSDKMQIVQWLLQERPMRLFDIFFAVALLKR